jgi:hypothetical protein
MYYLLLKNKEYSKARDISSEMKSIKPQKLKFTGQMEEVRKMKMLVTFVMENLTSITLLENFMWFDRALSLICGNKMPTRCKR